MKSHTVAFALAFGEPSPGVQRNRSGCRQCRGVIQLPSGFYAPTHRAVGSHHLLQKPNRSRKESTRENRRRRSREEECSVIVVSVVSSQLLHGLCGQAAGWVWQSLHASLCEGPIAAGQSFLVLDHVRDTVAPACPQSAQTLPDQLRDAARSQA